ncbi:DUF3017 domain-containing protein [Actinopolymorpha sp. B11F2]|uniref:DUF3017 domain-containing protein n=1 Tax=Actinopolymorpha sp. B11F2 TaxID=3160862 RepID=UPI0032E53109
MVDQPGSGVVPQTETSAGSTRSPSAGAGRPPRAPGLRQALWGRWKREPGRPLPPIRPWPRRQWPLLVVLTGIFVSLITVIVVDFRPGTLLLALSVLLAAAFRLVLTTRRAGLLVLRSRTTDVVTLTVMGVVALLLAVAVPDIR